MKNVKISKIFNKKMTDFSIEKLKNSLENETTIHVPIGNFENQDDRVALLKTYPGHLNYHLIQNARNFSNGNESIYEINTSAVKLTIPKVGFKDEPHKYDIHILAAQNFMRDILSEAYEEILNRNPLWDLELAVDLLIFHMIRNYSLFDKDFLRFLNSAVPDKILSLRGEFKYIDNIVKYKILDGESNLENWFDLQSHYVNHNDAKVRGGYLRLELYSKYIPLDGSRFIFYPKFMLENLIFKDGEIGLMKYDKAARRKIFTPITLDDDGFFEYYHFTPPDCTDIEIQRQLLEWFEVMKTREYFEFFKSGELKNRLRQINGVVDYIITEIFQNQDKYSNKFLEQIVHYFPLKILSLIMKDKFMISGKLLN